MKYLISVILVFRFLLCACRQKNYASESESALSMESENPSVGTSTPVKADKAALSGLSTLFTDMSAYIDDRSPIYESGYFIAETDRLCKNRLLICHSFDVDNAWHFQVLKLVEAPSAPMGYAAKNARRAPGRARRVGRRHILDKKETENSGKPISEFFSAVRRFRFWVKFLSRRFSGNLPVPELFT